MASYFDFLNTPQYQGCLGVKRRVKKNDIFPYHWCFNHLSFSTDTWHTPIWIIQYHQIAIDSKSPSITNTLQVNYAHLASYPVMPDMPLSAQQMVCRISHLWRGKNIKLPVACGVCACIQQSCQTSFQKCLKFAASCCFCEKSKHSFLRIQRTDNICCTYLMYHILWTAAILFFGAWQWEEQKAKKKQTYQYQLSAHCHRPKAKIKRQFIFDVYKIITQKYLVQANKIS